LLILDEGRRQIMFSERFDFGEEITGMARAIIGRAGESFEEQDYWGRRSSHSDSFQE